MDSTRFKCLVSFAAGTLLADVFLHLLPETFTFQVLVNKYQRVSYSMWLIVGLLTFLTIEKIFPDNNDHIDTKKKQMYTKKKTFFNSIKTVGVLNLVANVIDNFTHGIAVAGSFQASIKVIEY